MTSPPTPLASVVDELWERRPGIFVILDGSRIPDLRAWLQSQRLPYQCLFNGKKAISLADEAPYMLGLGGDRRALEQVVERFHDRRAVSYLESRAGFAAVRRQLRRMLLVKTTYGEVLYFRYYDPQVLRSFLPTCRVGQLRYLFGDVVDTWLVEARVPASLMAFTRAPDGATSTVRQAMVVR